MNTIPLPEAYNVVRPLPGRPIRALAAPEPGPGATVGGRWTLVALLGRGGVGTVFRARDARLDVDVAVKLQARGVPPGLSGEARAGLRLSHPGIVRVHTWGETDAWEYIVMEHVRGEDLARLRRRRTDGALGPEVALDVGLALLDALAHAHAHGVVHHDLKPGNVLRGPDGYHLCDFGLAAIDGVGVRGGCPAYMAPERHLGENGDARSDLYGLGATLWALATGTPPFGTAPDIARRGHLEGRLPPTPGLPAALRDVLARALAKRPEDRWPDAMAMRAALAALREEEQEAIPALEQDDAPIPALEADELEPTAEVPIRRAEVAFRPAVVATRPAVVAIRPAEVPIRPAEVPIRPAEVPIRPAEVPIPAAAVPPGMAGIPGREVRVGGRAVRTAPFLLDRAPVTNLEWAAFLQATGAPSPAHWLGARPPVGKERHPVVGVRLDEARAYAAWRGRRLPTELEWRAAAPNPRPPCAPGRCHCGAPDTAPVDAHPDGATPEGCVDLYGNVWEWTEADPRGDAPDAGCAWAMGGSHRHPCHGAEAPRTAIHAGKGSLYVGLRCAADVEGA